jgi:DNA-binding XRE family transcriptional regulator
MTGAREAHSRLKKLRVDAGYDSSFAFAKFLAVDMVAYDSIELGDYPITIELARRLRSKLGVNTDWLYFGKGKPNDLDKSEVIKVDHFMRLVRSGRYDKVLARMGYRKPR